MKKILLSCLLMGCGTISNVALASIEQYVLSVEKISEKYRQDTRNFFSSLDAQQTSFTPQQHVQFCGIVANYVEQLYQAADRNRDSLARQFRQMTKQDVIHQVMASKEMLILKKYNIQCDLK
ncbi:hypothetical protein [Acinetobacter sp.]|uniref:hypothetical protein n=1 Tax=Acinetobacter sp. TaxID=472 RepID=UPI00389056B0